MRKNTKKLKGSVLSALAVAIPALLGAVFYLFVAVAVGFGGGSVGLLGGGVLRGLFPAVILAVLGLLQLAAFIGVFAALHQRRKEIQSGEEDEAKKY